MLIMDILHQLLVHSSAPVEPASHSQHVHDRCRLQRRTSWNSVSPDCRRVTAARARALKSSSASKRALDSLYSFCRSLTSSVVVPSSPPGRVSAMCCMSMPNCVPQSPCKDHEKSSRAPGEF